MAAQSEQVLENKLIEQLIGLGYERVKVESEAALLTNLQAQLEKHNKTTFSSNEFKRVINHLEKGTVFEKANAGEAWALKLVDRSATAAAELAADLVTILGITKIAFGGSIGLATGYLDRVRKHLDAMPQLFHAELVTADLAENGPLIGALLNANRENIDENNHFSR